MRELGFLPQLAVQRVDRTFEHPPISHTTVWALRVIEVGFLRLSFLFAVGLRSECKLQDSRLHETYHLTCRKEPERQRQQEIPESPSVGIGEQRARQHDDRECDEEDVNHSVSEVDHDKIRRTPVPFKD